MPPKPPPLRLMGLGKRSPMVRQKIFKQRMLIVLNNGYTLVHGVARPSEFHPAQLSCAPFLLLLSCLFLPNPQDFQRLFSFSHFQMPCTIRWKGGGVQWSTTVLESTLRAGFRGNGSAGRAPASPPSAKSGTLAPQLARVRRVARGETLSVGTSRRPRPSIPYKESQGG